MILVVVQLLALLLSVVDSKVWVGPPYLFKFSSVAGMILTIYFGLRLANREFFPTAFLSLKAWIHKEGINANGVTSAQFALLGLNILIMVLLCFPPLAWTGAIARANIGSILLTPLLLFFYCLTYGVWGLVSAALWEDRLESRQIFIRCLFVSWFVLSALLYLPLNPVAFLLFQTGSENLQRPLVLWGSKWSASTILFLFHFFLLATGLLVHRHALKKGCTL
jgi:hypothetical protein